MIFDVFRIHCMISFCFVSQFTYSISFRFSVYRFCFVSSYFVVFRFALFRFSLYKDPFVDLIERAKPKNKKFVKY